MLSIKENIYWIGVKDWELKRFHGEELSTHRGSSYNSYLIKDEKTVLVDTVWSPYKEEFISRLEKEVGLDNIDLIVVNHCEVDHAGSLELLMSKIPDVPIYCTAKGAEMIEKNYHHKWNFQVVKTGDSVNIGKYELVFVEMPMLHWPDSMLTYVKGANLVLSNDAFGQHYAAGSLFNDEADNCEIYQEALKYYANILSPFSPLVKKKIDEIKAMNLPIDMIAPSHGIIWRENPMQIVEAYYKWAQNYQEDQVVIVYDTMWEATKKMAEAIGEGLEAAGQKVKIFNAGKKDKNDIITEIFKAKAVLCGCSTVNRGILSGMAALLQELSGLKLKKAAAAFASYGWSGEALEILTDRMTKGGFKIVQDGIQVQWQPNSDQLEECRAFGRAFAEKL